MNNRVSKAPFRLEPAPRSLWSRQHHGKLAHATHAAAAKYLALSDRPGQERREVYPCMWSDDWTELRTGPVHYHVGRPSKQDKQYPAAV